MIIQRGYISFPMDTILRTMLDSYRQVSSVIIASKLRCWDLSMIKCSCHRFLWKRLVFCLHQTSRSTSNTFSFLNSAFKKSLKLISFLLIPLAVTLISCIPISPPIYPELALAVSFFVVRNSPGKSPNGDYFILGSSLLSDYLKGLLVLLVTSFFKWSSMINVEACVILGMLRPTP